MNKNQTINTKPMAIEALLYKPLILIYTLYFNGILLQFLGNTNSYQAFSWCIDSISSQVFVIYYGVASLLSLCGLFKKGHYTQLFFIKVSLIFVIGIFLLLMKMMVYCIN